ncbi:hypothetical protein BBJ28_00005517 [Nothophytophthora sp. Chile5]|nr:hypothetical protein BBJ28_00005517 [Nothophytophthora sp. Chile5]
MRQLLGWTRPVSLTASPQLAPTSRRARKSSSNNKDEGDGAVFAQDPDKAVDDDLLLTPEPTTPRANNNTSIRDLELSFMDPDDKATCPPPRPGSRSVTEKAPSRPRSTRCSSVDSSSSTATSSRPPSSLPLPTTSGSALYPTLLSPPTQSPPRVTFRKGEKSFLDFHQHYAITRHLGEGSYSTVKQVTHRQKGGFFACKIVDKLSLSVVDRAALAHEVRVLSSVSHVNIMRLHEVIEDDAKCYLVTELAEGGDLFDRIVKQGKFPEREAQKVAAALVEALHYCHARSIIHRDVKPENVLLSGDDVKLCDFGFARQLNDPEEQSTDSCGTPGYAAPEILDGRSYGLEVDVFSLGVVTYIMLCGYPPFPMKLAQLRTHRFNVRYPSKDWAAVHPDVKTLISKMLHVDPTERPSMAMLRSHPWIQAGRATLERLRREGEERRRVADLTRRQHAASAIRKKLVMGGFEAVKYGRNGMPHRTKLRLSADGKCLSWQPKLLKRGLLRYQNARSFTSLFGIGGKEHNSNSQPDLHVAQPQLNRGVSDDVAGDDRDESELSATPSSAATTSHDPVDSSENNTSPSSSTLDVINEKRLWWRSLRRERHVKTERTASGGIALKFNSTRKADSTPSSPVTSPAIATPPAGVSELQGVAPSSPASPERLDDSIKLHDIREMLVGEHAPFFAGHATNQPNTSKRAVDPACVLSVATRFRELHLEFPNGGVRDGFVYLLQQATLPLEQHTQYQPPLLVLSSALPPAPLSSQGFRDGDSSMNAALEEEPAQQLNEQEAATKTEPESQQPEHSSHPEVDDEDARTVAKEATATAAAGVSTNNQDE